MEVKKGGDQQGRTNANKISETPRNQSKGNVGSGDRGTSGPISFTVKKPRG